MMVLCKCGSSFQAVSAPCPDGVTGCCVAHFNKDSFICPTCSHNNGPDITKGIMENGVSIEPGISIINTNAVNKLEILWKTEQ